MLPVRVPLPTTFYEPTNWYRDSKGKYDADFIFFEFVWIIYCIFRQIEIETSFSSSLEGIFQFSTNIFHNQPHHDHLS